MSKEVMTMDRFSEIKRQLEISISVNQICRNLNCSDRTVRLIRGGKMIAPDERENNLSGPLWSEQADWQLVRQSRSSISYHVKSG